MGVVSTRRLNRGKSHSYVLDGAPVMGVTTIINKALPKPALTTWAAREVAEFVASRREILTQLSEEELIDLCKGAPFRERDRAANRGTEVHRLAERLASGEELEIPEELVGHVDAYLGFLEAFQPSDAILERPLFNRTQRYAGTADMFCKLQLPQRGRVSALVDLKTGGSGVYPETAIQLAAYAHAEFMVNQDGAEVHLPQVDFYGALWVRADGFELYEMHVTDREWRTFQFLQQVAYWLEVRAPQVRGDAIWVRQEIPA